MGFVFPLWHVVQGEYDEQFAMSDGILVMCPKCFLINGMPSKEVFRTPDGKLRPEHCVFCELKCIGNTHENCSFVEEFE